MPFCCDVRYTARNAERFDVARPDLMLISLIAAVYAVVVRGAEFRGQRDDIADEIVRRYVAGLDSALSRGSRGAEGVGDDDERED